MLLAIAATGCATTADVQQQPPSRQFQTSKTALELEQCFALRLSRYGLPSTIRGPASTIMAYGQPNPAFTLTILVGTQTMVELRTPIAKDSGIQRDITPCL
ncbi:MAG: hypothetical protein V4618_00900 [Pseudomonadota bacterium]